MPDIANAVISWGGTTISDVASFGGPGIGHEALDVTDINDTTAIRIASGIYDAGEATVELHFDPDAAIHDQMADDCIAGTSRALKIEWQNGTSATTSWSCNAFCTRFEPSGDAGGKLSASVTLTATGALTIS